MWFLTPQAKFDDQAPENRPYAAGQEGNWNFTSYPSMYIVGLCLPASTARHTPAVPEELLLLRTNTSAGPEDGEFPLATKHKNWYKGGKESAENIVYHMTEVANGKNQRDAWFGWLDTEKRTKPGMYKKGLRWLSRRWQCRDVRRARSAVRARWVVSRMTRVVRGGVQKRAGEGLRSSGLRPHLAQSQRSASARRRHVRDVRVSLSLRRQA